jgi:phosphate transport system protein
VAGYRHEFDRQLDAIDAKVMELFAMVCEDLRPVTQAVLNGHNEVAGLLAERERAIDSLYREIEQLVSREILLQAPVASDLRFLLSVLRIAPELERSHDLVCHIASRADRIPGAELSSRCRELIRQMDELVCGMWRRAADCWCQRDGSVASALAEADDELDELHASLVAELVSGPMAPPVMMEMTLVARFYERLGDHAVNIARRVIYLAGSAPARPLTVAG